jgi:hypothetical protein
MKFEALQIPVENTQEYRRAGNRRIKWLSLGGGIATIILAVPIVITAIGKSYQIADTPNQIVALTKHQQEIDNELTAQKASMHEIREGLNRILSAMHLDLINEPVKPVKLASP